MRLYIHDEAGAEHTVCHYNITKGEIKFGPDCEHGLKGRTVPLPEWPYAPGEYGGIEE